MKEINAFEHSNVVSDKFKGFQSVILTMKNTQI